jgi:amino acid adenylation domain-containing protein
MPVANAPGPAASLVELLGHWAAVRPEQVVYTFLDSAGHESAVLDFAEIDRQARAVAAALVEQDGAGERALLLYPPGLDFIAAFLGCLYARTIAVPAYPPRPERSIGRLRAIAVDAGARIVLTTAGASPAIRALAAQVPELTDARIIATDRLPPPAPAPWPERLPSRDDTAFLQYTSGSTADPKGVIVTHGNLLHNEEMIRRAFAQDDRSVVVGWLPLYHDMGLIGNVLQPLYLGARAILMSPLSFLQRPLRWLEAISRYRATTSGGPNFAFELCVRRIGPAERAALDLSSWQVAFSGAEPVRARTLAAFVDAFTACGFRREALYPCYGLAEATLFVTGGSVGAGPSVARFALAALEQHRAVAMAGPAGADDAGGDAASRQLSRQLVSCGHPWLDQEVAIADPESRRRCGAGQVGEVWIAGPSVASGYWGREETTAAELHARLAGEPARGPFLRTGDLGFVWGGDLFVTGRLKELIILGGRNLYPQDVELVAEGAHPALRPGCGAAFAVEVEDEERLVVAWEVERRSSPDLEAVAGRIRQALAEELEAAVHEVVFLSSGTLPKTSSGKIRRRACRAAWLRGELTVVGRSTAASQEGPPVPPARLNRAALAALTAAARRPALLAHLGAELARAARIEPALVVPGKPLVRLGLESLAAVRLAQELEVSFGVSVPISELLGGLDLDGLAGHLLDHFELAPAAGPPPPAPPPAPTNPDAPIEVPLTYGQQGLWFLQRLAPESGPYHLAGAARVRPAWPGGAGLDVATLRRALDRLVQRHEILRTTFGDAGGEPVQQIRPSLSPSFLVVDAAAASDAELLAALEREAYRPFDLAAGPLLRCAIFQRWPGECVLLLAAHHVIADFWTLGMLLRELAACYAGQPLAPPLLAWADHVRRELAAMTGPEGEQLWAWWRGQLAPPVPELVLPTDRPRPPVQSFRGGAAAVRLGTAVSQGLLTLARTSEATLFATLLAVFLTLLHRYSGQESLAIGSPAACRRRPELAGLAGYLVNPLLLRVELAGRPRFAEALARVRRTALAALAHQEYPFVLLAERLQPDRDLSRDPLLPAMFVLQQAEQAEDSALAAWALGMGGVRLGFADLAFESCELPVRFSPFDLMLRMAEVDGGLVASLQYASDLFDLATIRRMLGHLSGLLAGAAAAPGLHLDELPLLSAAEHTQLVVEWNATATGGEEGACLHLLVERQVERTPDAVAVAGPEPGTALTYAALDARVRRLAGRLRSLGVGPEVVVGIAARRSAAMVAGLLAVLEAGGAYLPLDPDQPAERSAFMLADGRAAVLLCDRELAGRLPPHGARIVLLDASDSRDAPMPALPPRAATDPENLAYVIYTSGSTGRPKGVEIRHRAAVNYVHSLVEQLGLGAADVMMAVTTLSFDIALTELLLPLTVGARVALVDRHAASDAAPLAAAIDDAGASCMQATPATWTQLLEGGWPGRRGLKVLCGGEALPRKLADRLLARAPEIWNLYGPTETTVWSAALRVSAGDTPVPLGLPLANTSFHLLGPGDALVPIGVAAELAIGGEGLARGYRGRPDLTAERFTPDPFGGPGARLYRTGDRARRLPDGTLEFLGRLDHQIKIRGHRIEPGEVEAALRTHPDVREAVAVAQTDLAGDLRLVAYVVPRAGRPPETAEISRYLRERLPAAMVPSVLVPLPALPLNSSGKVDRAALPRAAAAPAAGHVAPRSPLEASLAAIWERVLGVERVGVEDDFFALGGHSLSATRVLAALREGLSVELPVRSLFEARTVARLAATVARERLQGAAPAADRIPRRPEHLDRLPLSFGQERLWLLDQLQPGSPAYNLPLAVRLRGPLRTPELARAMLALALRHEVLRTRFPMMGGQPVQVAGSAAGVWPRLVDLGGLPPPAREAAVARWVRQQARRPFLLASAPPLRSLLLRLAGDEHVLVLTLHHIAGDAWSLGILMRDLAALYQGLAASNDPGPPALPPLPIQYADFALWQRGRLAGELLAQQLAHCRRELAGLSDLELAGDRPRPQAASWRGADLPVRVPPSLLAELQARCTREGVTLFVGLLAGLWVLLARYTSQDDLAVGAVVASRTRPELEELIGFFSNILVLRATAVAGSTVEALLARLRDASLDAFTHQDLPFERLVAELNPERSLGRHPLVQVLFSFHQAPLAAALPGSGLAVERLAAASGAARCDLFFHLWEEGGGLAGGIEYSTDLFDADRMARLSGHYQALLAALASRPGQRLSELPLLAAGERHQLICEWNDTAARPATGLVHELFARQAARVPGRPAVVSGGCELDFRALDERANRLAHHLRARGAGADGRIGVCLPRSEEIVVTLLGVLKAGSAYVPLDPDYPQERLAFMVADARLTAVVTDRPHAGRFAAHPAAAPALLVLVDAERAAIATCAAAARGSPPAPPDSLAYLLYTSGSTGVPKGVMVAHSNLVSFFAALDAALGGTADGPPGRWLAHTSICFDISALELLWTLTRGHTIVLPPAGAEPGAPAGDGASLAELVLRHEISGLQATPSALSAAVLDPDAPAACSRLGHLLAGGEALPEPLAARLAAVVGGQLRNVYGPTETTVWSAAALLSRGASVTIGRPLANTALHLLDDQGLAVPVGLPGEIYIGGAGVARGYWGRPELTAERFVPDPFAARPGDRLYRTGDLARRLPDGRIAFLGRRDHQVKIRGQRIELGEIETVLAAHPAVRQAVAVAHLDAPAGPQLVAYVVPADADVPLSREELAVFARSRLAPAMCPQLFVVLPALPLTPNGKVDRRALPLPRQAGSRDGTRSGPPTGLEAAVAAIWRDVLGVEPRGNHDNFFDLGGHSLALMQLRSRLRTALAVDLPLRDLFLAPTVAGQAAAAAQALRGGAPGARGPLAAGAWRPPVGEEGEAPLSFAQERLWFLAQLEPASAAYNLPAALRLEGELAPHRLARALAAIVDRHAALRTTIRVGGSGAAGRPVQVVASRLALGLPLVDLGRLAAGPRDAQLDLLAAAEALRPFDLAAGPLVRTALARLAPREHVLLVTLHHVVCDGWSLGVFLDELAALYAAGGHPAEAGLAPLPLQYADYAAWQRRRLAGEALEGLLAYWRRRLAGAPAVLALPADRPRPAVQSHRGATRPFALDGGAVAALRALGRGEGATLFMTLLACWATALHRYSGQHDLVIGTPTANREHAELEPLIGLLVNSVALRLDLGGDPTLRGLLGRVRTALLPDYAHQEAPFEKLVEHLRPERSLGHNPIYQAVFALEIPGRERVRTLPGLRLVPLPGRGATAKFDLALYLEDVGDRLAGQLEISSDLFDPATAARWLRHFQVLLAAAPAAAELRLSELPLVTREERHQVLIEANDTQRPPCREAFVHRLIERWAAATPDASALSHEGFQLTYGELDRRAGRLARRLRALGVGPEVRVAVASGRSPELIVALLAVLEAGGVYLPLDPTYPPERLRFLLADSRAEVVLVDRASAAHLPQAAAVMEPLGEGGDAPDAPDAAAVPVPAAPLAPGNLAYVIYTSGSTGQPRGAMIEHRSLASYTATALERYGIRQDDRVLQFCSISFDISIEEIVPCLTAGAELVLRSDAMIGSAGAFLAACRERSITVLSLPTAYWHEVVAGLESEGLELPPSLRLVIIAGERALPGRLGAWRRRAPQRPRLLNTYGLTESTIISTVADLTALGRHAGDGAREVPIGRTIADTDLHLLDRRLAPVPLGVAGEIYLGGGLLARGYLHRPGTTAERFVPDPFATRPGARLYRTGDLARRLHQGDLEFLGRGDQQVKIRGYRVELGEVEAALGEHPAVAAAAATIDRDPLRQPRLIAHLVWRPDAPQEALAELRAFLRRRLPEYMVPAAFVILPELPLTPNGKLDRAALPPPVEGRAGVGEEFVAPRDEPERVLAAIWREALGLERIGIHDNFFDLGGHSLLLVEIQARLRQRFGRTVSMVELFRHPTVGTLARHLREATAGKQQAAQAAAAAIAERAARGRAAVGQQRFAGARRRAQEAP